MTEFFQNVRAIIFPPYDFETRIAWKRVNINETMPPYLAQLASNIDDTVALLNEICLEALDDPKEFHILFSDLFRIAKCALEGDNHDESEIKSAANGILRIQRNMLRKCNIHRSKYFDQYNVIAAIIIGPCLLMAVCFEMLWHFGALPDFIRNNLMSTKYYNAVVMMGSMTNITNDAKILLDNASHFLSSNEFKEIAAAEIGKYTTFYKNIIAILAATCWIAIGATIGNLVMFIFRNAEINIDNVMSVNEYRWAPAESYKVVIICGWLIGIVVALNIVQLGVSGVLLNDFMTKDPVIAIIIGLTTAVGFIAIKGVIHGLQVNKRD